MRLVGDCEALPTGARAALLMSNRTII